MMRNDYVPGLDPCDFVQFLGRGGHEPASRLFGCRKGDVVTEYTKPKSIESRLSNGRCCWVELGRPQAGTYSHAWRRVRVVGAFELVTVGRDGDKVAWSRDGRVISGVLGWFVHRNKGYGDFQGKGREGKTNKIGLK